MLRRFHCDISLIWSFIAGKTFVLARWPRQSRWRVAAASCSISSWASRKRSRFKNLSTRLLAATSSRDAALGRPFMELPKAPVLAFRSRARRSSRDAAPGNAEEDIDCAFNIYCNSSRDN